MNPRTIRTRPTKRTSSKRDHATYGIYKWFKIKTGIYDRVYILELIDKFYSLNKGDSKLKPIDFVDRNFSKFASYAKNESKNYNGKQKH